MIIHKESSHKKWFLQASLIQQQLEDVFMKTFFSSLRRKLETFLEACSLNRLKLIISGMHCGVLGLTECLEGAAAGSISLTNEISVENASFTHSWGVLSWDNNATLKTIDLTLKDSIRHEKKMRNNQEITFNYENFGFQYNFWIKDIFDKSDGEARDKFHRSKSQPSLSAFNVRTLTDVFFPSNRMIWFPSDTNISSTMLSRVFFVLGSKQQFPLRGEHK